MEQLGIALAAVAVGLIGLEAIIRPLRKASERTATAAELTALYVRELCWRTHDAGKPRNGRGELMIWQDPAEIPSIAGSILADASERAERKMSREERFGPDATSYAGSDTGPEAEAIKRQTAKAAAEFEAWLSSMGKSSDVEDQR
jgi:hypothetical protein